jgi:hypothetical protein
MGSTLYAKGNPIYVDNTTDFETANSLGKLVTFTNGVPALVASATLPATGVIMDARTRTPLIGGTTYYDNSIGILGCLEAPVRVAIDAGSVALNPGDRVMQTAAGTVTKEVTGSARFVVGILTDKNGAQPGDLAEVTLFTPQYLTY